MRDWLREIRNEKKYTQGELAAEAGISQSYYAWIETGKRGKHLPVDTAQRIAAVLDFDYLLFYRDQIKEGA